MMNTLRVAIALAIAMPVVASGQAETVPVSTAIKTVEQRWAAAIEGCNAGILDAILHEELTFVQGPGVLEAKDAVMKRAARCDVDRVEIRPSVVRLLDWNAALVHGTMRLKSKGKAMGSWVTYTRVYVRQGSGWRLIAHHGTEVSKPRSP